MRELVLNDACLGGGALPVEAAAALAEDVERGLARLVSAGHAMASMRLAASPGEVVVSPGVTLADVLLHLLRNTSSGRLLSRLATKYPVENDVDDGELAAMVDWSIPLHAQSLALVLCARSGRIAVTISADGAWQVDPLVLEVQTDPLVPGTTTAMPIDNVFSAASASALSGRLTEAFIATARPADLWRERARLFPHLDFAPRVQGDIADLGPMEYESAVSRLGEIERAASGWSPGTASPTYLSRVTGEHKATMNQYGDRRVFRSSNGRDETFEKHARLAGGFRLHLREIADCCRIEVGYIGPHLPIASEN